MQQVETINFDDYETGQSFPKKLLFDKHRMKRLFASKWFFVGTRGDVPKVGNYLSFNLFENSYFLVHGNDGNIRCFVNRCAHQSALLVRENVGKTLAKIVCPNHQWTYHLNDGSLNSAARMPQDFALSEKGKGCGLDSIELREIQGLLFACLGKNTETENDALDIERVIEPYLNSFNVDKGGYKLAYHERVEIDANWLIVMLNNRECCHCSMNHKGLLKLFSDDSFNGSKNPKYLEMFEQAIQRWEAKGFPWQEQAFDNHDSCRIARYPMKEGYKSTSFDGNPCSKKLIGPHQDYDEGTLSFWFNPNVWIHFTSDHIATNWVLPLSEKKCVLYTSWIVHENAVEGEDYHYQQMTDVWKVTNSEDEDLCVSMTQGALSDYYKPGYFSEDERHCKQFCDWYVKYSQ